MQFIQISERILLTLWVGGLWAIGYIVAPTLFASLDDRSLAGNLAGQMFHVINYIGLVCAILLFASSVIVNGFKWRALTLLLMFALIVCGEFVIQPMMAELKLQGLVPGSEAKSQFGMLHGISSVLYLVTSICGLLLIVFGVRKFSPDLSNNDLKYKQ